MEWKKFVVSWILGSVILYVMMLLISAITIPIPDPP